MFKTREAAAQEKKAALALLEYLSEVDRRRLHVGRGYSSLWEFVHKALGYSESQASERISAMRLMVKVPEVKEQLSVGGLTLTATAKLAAHVRRESLAPAETVNLLNDVTGKSTREVERILVANAVEPPMKFERIKAITSSRTRVSFDVNENFMKLLDRVRELKGNPALSLEVIFLELMNGFVNRTRELEPETPELRAPEMKLGARGENVPNHSRYIRVRDRAVVAMRSQGRCEYVDSLTGRRCESRSGLEFDHIVPFAKGGRTQAANLRQFCRAHNSWAAIQAYGRRKMNRYLKQ